MITIGKPEMTVGYFKETFRNLPGETEKYSEYPQLVQCMSSPRIQTNAS
jgi:hypothetical protein